MHRRNIALAAENADLQDQLAQVQLQLQLQDQDRARSDSGYDRSYRVVDYRQVESNKRRAVE